MNGRLAFPALVTMLCVLAACSDEALQTLAPGQVHEVCMVLAPPEQLEYAFTANAGLRFNIHYHVGDKIVYPLPEQLISHKQGVFQATASQEYCLMWTNPATQPVDLELEYTRRGASG
jgi:hypothetical protein